MKVLENHPDGTENEGINTIRDLVLDRGTSANVTRLTPGIFWGGGCKSELRIDRKLELSDLVNLPTILTRKHFPLRS